MKEEVVVVVSLCLLLFLCAVFEIVASYKKESQYIKMELTRACTHSEKTHWKRELKRLRKRYFPLLYIFSKSGHKHK